MKILELYKQGNSINEVARITGIHRSNIYRAVKKAGINRTVSESMKGKRLSDIHKKRISKGLINSEKHKKSKLKRRKQLKRGYNIITKELSYIAGVLITDGYIYNSMGIGLESIDKEFTELFAKCGKKQFGISPSRYENPPRPMTDPRNGKIYQTKKRYVVRFGSKTLEEFCKQINTSWIRALPNKFKLYALCGMWDGDGCYSNGSQQVLFYNKNEDIIKLYGELLNLLSIKGRYYEQSYSGVFKYYFGRQSQIKKFFKVIKPTIKRKYKQYIN